MTDKHHENLGKVDEITTGLSKYLSEHPADQINPKRKL